MKKLLALVFAAMMLTVSAFAEGEKPLEGKKLKIALSANYKFFETIAIDEKGNEYYEGLDIDILDHMAQELGFEYEIANMPFASLIGTLQTNQADFVISGMSATEERKKTIDFSYGYSKAPMGILTKADSGINGLSDLSGKTVACSTGTTYELVIQSIPGTTLKTYDGQAAITQELLLGRVDASITGGVACRKVCSENPGLKYLIFDESEILMDSNLSEFAIAFPKGSELLPYINEELLKMKEDGSLSAILTKWLGEDMAIVPDMIPAKAE